MQTRFDYAEAAPKAYQAAAALDRYIVKDSGIPPRILHLLKLRASIINGCAFCVDMHRKEALHSGLSEQWVNMVSVWHESVIFTEQERAVLAWTDALTLVADTGAPDADFEAICKHFSQAEVVNISLAIAGINVWNRLAVGFRKPHPIDSTP